jgi:hypothetical protein
MPFVPVPKDLTKVKTKVMFGLTKRQLVCFGVAAVIGVPTYLLTRGVIGNSAAVIIMILLMLPAFFIAMYEKDGQPAEKIIRNIIRSRYFFPRVRPYRTENIYTAVTSMVNREEKRYIAVKDQKAETTGKSSSRKHRSRASE